MDPAPDRAPAFHLVSASCVGELELSRARWTSVAQAVRLRSPYVEASFRSPHWHHYFAHHAKAKVVHGNIWQGGNHPLHVDAFMCPGAAV